MSKTTNHIKIISLLLLVLIATFTGGCIKSFDENSQVHVSNVDVAADKVRSSFVDLNVTSTIENRGVGASDNITLILKAYNTNTGFLEFEGEEELGILEGDSFVDDSMVITLPKRDGYDLRIRIFENGKELSGGYFQIRNLESLPADVNEIGIEIQEMDFLVKDVDSGKVTFQADVYLANEGLDKNDNYRMLLKAREMDTRLIADKVWTSTGSFAPDATIIRSVNLTVPDNYNYAVEVILWDGDTIINRGEDYVQLNPTVEIDRDTRIQSKNVDTSDFIMEEPQEELDYGEYEAPGTPGFSSLLVVCSLLGAAFVLIRRSKDE
ncbi:hypothetical protein J2755_001544 [Methanohalophilus levihalophilus]|uniref:DUF7490 domain-containing protein n=1 Tax=Methanohalophilus levihalophilus TaxID=1431282 RepID=UPI001AEB80E8|nr:hypothetical protein [Methanohalophilus levihalophilus]MBP2030596.1 hypothetical protein [Methanohalophilus levihalophilus]